VTLRDLFYLFIIRYSPGWSLIHHEYKLDSGSYH